MKFDCIVSNAPYNNGLHEKFEAKYFDICDGLIVWVSPLSFLLGKKQNKRITLELDKYKTDIEQINGNEYFDAAIGGTTGIVFCDMNNGTDIKFDGKNYSKCEEITSYSNNELLIEFKNIIEPLYKIDCLHNHIKYGEKDCHEYDRRNHLELNPNPDWWCVKIANIRGNVAANGVKSDFYTLISNNPKEVQKSTRQYGIMSKEKNKMGTCLINTYFAFNAYNEQQNFISYIKTDFFRGCLYLIKTTSSLITGEMRNLPWFDFSDPVFSKSPSEIDDYLFAKYNISDEIRKHIEDLLPDYYSIRK